MGSRENTTQRLKHPCVQRGHVVQQNSDTKRFLNPQNIVSQISKPFLHSLNYQLNHSLLKCCLPSIIAKLCTFLRSVIAHIIQETFCLIVKKQTHSLWRPFPGTERLSATKPKCGQLVEMCAGVFLPFILYFYLYLYCLKSLHLSTFCEC